MHSCVYLQIFKLNFLFSFSFSFSFLFWRRKLMVNMTVQTVVNLYHSHLLIGPASLDLVAKDINISISKWAKSHWKVVTIVTRTLWIVALFSPREKIKFLMLHQYSQYTHVIKSKNVLYNRSMFSFLFSFLT